MEEGLVLPEQWHLITKFLSVKDLCYLMQVSPAWFSLWVSDRAWSHQRARICQRFPDLEDLFIRWSKPKTASDHTCKSSERSNSNKKRKVIWVFPVWGTWHVFKRWLMVGRDMHGVKKLAKLEDTDALVTSIIRTLVPCNELIVHNEFKVTKDTIRVDLYWKSGMKFSCCIHMNHNWFESFIVRSEDGQHYYEVILNWYMREWVDFVLQRIPDSARQKGDILQVLKDVKEGL